MSPRETADKKILSIQQANFTILKCVKRPQMFNFSESLLKEFYSTESVMQ